MASPTPAPAPAQGTASTIYRVLMTPIIFVSFLFSLAFVEFRYSLSRTHTHGPGQQSMQGNRPHRLPPWLHRIIYQQSRPDDAHYHSMQRKLLKMEADEAFRIRSTVLFVLGLLLAGAAWMAATAGIWMAAWLSTREAPKQ